MNIKRLLILLLLNIFSISSANFENLFLDWIKKEIQKDLINNSQNNQDKSEKEDSGSNLNVAIIYISEKLDFKQVTLNLINAAKNKDIKGVVLMINNYGGAMGGFSVIHDLIKKISNIKPVISLILDGACSGGYMVASAANYVMAHRCSDIGHIGVYSQIFKYKNSKLKGDVEADINVETFQSGEYKTLHNNYSEDLSDEHKKYLQENTETAYKDFLNIVAENRKLNLNNYKDWAEGKIFNGTQALNLGLIDEIGTILDIEDKLIEILTKRNIPNNIEIKQIFYPETGPDFKEKNFKKDIKE